MSREATLQLREDFLEMRDEGSIDFDYVEVEVKYPHDFPIKDWDREGDFDILGRKDFDNIFFEVKGSINDMEKAFKQVAKGVEFLDVTGTESRGGIIIAGEPGGRFLDQIDSMGDFFTRDSFDESGYENFDHFIQKAKFSHVISPLEWMLKRDDYGTGVVEDDAHYSVFDAETLMNHDLISHVEDDRYMLEDELEELVESTEGYIFHKTPRYEMVTSPYKDSFEQDIQKLFG